MTLWVYWPAVHCDFIGFDDPVYVAANPRVQTGLTVHNAIWAFTTGSQSNWHPLTWLSLMLDRDLFGSLPSGFHLTNVVLHAFDTVLLFWLLRRLTGASWRSGAVAALFAWHPAHVESVAWVAERKDVLSTFFGFLSLLFYAHYAQEGEMVNESGDRVIKKAATSPFYLSFSYRCAWLCFALGLLSKSMLVTWPLVMWLLDFWPLQRWRTVSTARLVLEKIPFLVLTAAASAVTLMVQRHGGAVATIKILPLSVRCENSLVAYCRYLGKLFWPSDLAIFYPHSPVAPAPLVVVLTASFLAGLTLLFFFWRRSQPYLLTGWLWFGGTMVPVIGLVQVGDQGLADRYTYIPSVGILIAAIWGAQALIKRWHLPTALLPSFGVVIALLCVGLTRHQLGYWQNSETLFRHTLAVTKNNYVILNNLGAVLTAEGRTDEAMEPLQKALLIRPHDAMVHYNLGIVHSSQGHKDKAISEFKEALRLKPDYVDAHFNLGLTLASMDRLDEAIAEFRATVQLQPDFINAHNNLGTALATEGHYDEAIAQFREVLRLDPDFVHVQDNLALALKLQGEQRENSHAQ